jgi:cytochrome P450
MPNRHMTFGPGIHRCLGSHFDRLEMKVMVQQVLRRRPDCTADESELTFTTMLVSHTAMRRCPSISRGVLAP